MTCSIYSPTESVEIRFAANSDPLNKISLSSQVLSHFRYQTVVDFSNFVACDSIHAVLQLQSVFLSE